ncbi:Phage repressor protein C, contains Cro/C1-type HTH and peptisase s24 domains [Massilia yuzhufengensis]|uniref:Phage repressor protein C, contains Cro/C1-type HTH and peptisase s24 domains n=2 Tax=Massilia yuzhufengensis TaxID=1164594 RepID=A0A1I1VLL5_9BURK|nr:Phage repressor protein C, contains Cro/C1-type HTH and peptisase s24 domains [Massilia yuzhufengensis]
MQAAGILSQNALARASGIPQPTINRILKGTGKKGPETNTLTALAQACNVSVQWLTDGTGQMARTPGEAPQEAEVMNISVDDEAVKFVAIRLVARFIHAGLNGHGGDIEYDDHLVRSVPLDWILEKRLIPSKLVGIRVKGDSMYPTLRKGNVVIVNTADCDPRNLADGQLYAVNHNDRPVVKRLELVSGRWHLSSDNPLPEYRSRPVDESTEIIGRVVRMEADFI